MLDNLVFAISQYSEFNSIPIHLRFNFSQTIAVVPEPTNGSKTKSFLLVDATPNVQLVLMVFDEHGIFYLF